MCHDPERTNAERLSELRSKVECLVADAVLGDADAEAKLNELREHPVIGQIIRFSLKEMAVPDAR